MKWLISLVLITCAGHISAQVNIQVAYNFSTRLARNHKERCNGLYIESSYKNFILSSSFGKENWLYHNTSQYIPDSVNYAKSSLNKLDFFVGYKIHVFKLDLRFLYGIRTYFRNNVEKNLSFYDSGSKFSFTDDLELSNLNRDRILHSYPSYEINDTYRYISEMRFAHLLKINVSYTYKNIDLNVYYMPNLIHFKYETPLEPKEYGSNYLLFHDVGVGLSYTFKVKSKKQE